VAGSLTLLLLSLLYQLKSKGAFIHKRGRSLTHLSTEQKGMTTAKGAGSISATKSVNVTGMMGKNAADLESHTIYGNNRLSFPLNKI